MRGAVGIRRPRTTCASVGAYTVVRQERGACIADGKMNRDKMLPASGHGRRSPRGRRAAHALTATPARSARHAHLMPATTMLDMGTLTGDSCATNRIA